MPKPIRETRVLKLVFITIPCLKFWAQWNKTPQLDPLSLSSTPIPQIDGGILATPKHPETEPSSQDTHENVSSLPTIHDSTHPSSSVNRNLNSILFLTIPEGYEFTPFDIDTSFIYQICKPHGEINKIVMIERYKVYHALVEFKSAENALEAKTILNNTELFPDEPWLHLMWNFLSRKS